MNRQIFSLALLSLVFVARFLCAQSAQSTPAATLETTVEQVLLDVVVTNHDKHIYDLDRARFHVFEDGHEQKFGFFEEHKHDANPAPIAQPALPPNIVGNAPAYSNSDTIDVLLIDALNTPAANQQELRSLLIDYLEKLPPGRPIAIFTLTTKLTQLQGFTSDRQKLEAAIRSVKNGAKPSAALDASDPYEAMQFDVIFSFGRFFSAADSAGYALDRRVEYTLDAFNNLAKYLSLLPGRKNLIWFSGSFPLVTFPDDGFNGILRSARTYTTQINETAANLAAARVSIYPVQVRGLQTHDAYSVTKNMTDDSNLYGTTDMGNFAQDQTMQNLAQETGGVAYLHSNDLMASLRSALENGDDYYTIGFTPNEKGKGNEYHKLKVIIDGAEGDTIDYRHSYFKKQSTAVNDALNTATMPGAPTVTDLQFIARALPASDAQFSGATLPQGPAGELAASLKQPVTRYVLDIKVDAHKITFSQPDANTHLGQLEFIIVAYDAKGNRVNYLDRGINMNLGADKFAAVQANGAPVRFVIDLPTGNLTLRLVVHDKTSGKLGAIELPLSIVAK